jgi:predicted RNA-binding Zn-ribbon protein involved in translation (DUF1610 family)
MASLSGQGKCVACGSVFTIEKAGRKAKCPYCGKAQDSRKAVSDLAATMAQQTVGYQAVEANAPVAPAAAPKSAANEKKAYLVLTDVRLKPVQVVGLLLVLVFLVCLFSFAIKTIRSYNTYSYYRSNLLSMPCSFIGLSLLELLHRIF